MPSQTPLVSVIIPAYNNAQYLPDCLRSLLRQTCGEWQAVVVVDGSPDDSADVARRFARDDGRITVIDKPRNEGTHLARTTGVEHATGRYALFLDADDELTDDALESLVGAMDEGTDVLHFGMEIVNEGLPQSECDAMLRLCNPALPDLHDDQVPLSSFSPEGEQTQDWRILQRLYRTGPLKRAFDAMTDRRLGRGQDSYEWFVISSLTRCERFRDDLVCYRYHLGRGVTGTSAISAAKFTALVNNFADMADLAKDYARDFRRYPGLMDCADGYRRRLVAPLTGDWVTRVPDDEKIEAAQPMADRFGALTEAEELMRAARDAAYALWDTHAPYTGEEPFHDWIELARRLAGSVTRCCVSHGTYDTYESQVCGHVADLARRMAATSVPSPAGFRGICTALAPMTAPAASDADNAPRADGTSPSYDILADLLLNRLDRADRPEALTFALGHGDADALLASLARVGWDHPGRVLTSVGDAEALRTPAHAIGTVGIYYCGISTGGAERVTCSLIDLWTSMGYHVVLFTDWGPKPGEYAIPDSVTRVVLPNCWTITPDNYRARARALREALAEHHVDALVYGMWTSNILAWDLLTCKAAGVPFLAHTHSAVRTMLGEGDPKTFELAQVYRYADGVVALSETDRLFWSRTNPRVWRTVNRPTIRPVPGRRSPLSGHGIVWVGRLSPEKRPDEALRIMRHVVDAMPDATLTMVGPVADGVRLEDLEGQRHRLGLDDAVRFVGRQADVLPFLRDAAAFLMTSDYEGYPLALAEAKTAGLPCVLYALPYLTLTEGNRGVVQVEHGDDVAAAAALVRLLGDEELRRRTGDEAFAHMEELDAFSLKDWWWGIRDATAQGSPDRSGFAADDLLNDVLVLSLTSSVGRTRTADRAERDRIGRELDETRRQADAAQTDLGWVRGSTAYRVGRIATWPMRRLKDAVRAIRRRAAR